MVLKNPVYGVNFKEKEGGAFYLLGLLMAWFTFFPFRYRLFGSVGLSCDDYISANYYSSYSYGGIIGIHLSCIYLGIIAFFFSNYFFSYICLT